MRLLSLAVGLNMVAGVALNAQQMPIAIVPTEGAKLTGAMSVANGKAMIGASGTVSAGEHPVTITLPRRGNLRLCATTTVSLTADSSIAASVPVNSAAGPAEANPVPEAAGLMMALNEGALEANFATGRNSDVILTPDFRILISGPGMAAVRVRLGAGGDTCVDNHGPDAPYVSVSSIFAGGLYRVQPDQRVMFQHGSLSEVVDQEKESCGCPPELPASVEGNDFPVAQSAGLAPLPSPPPNVGPPGTVNAQATVQLSYDGTQTPRAAADKSKPAESETAAPTTETAAPSAAPKPAPKPGFFTAVGRFFRRLFGG